MTLPRTLTCFPLVVLVSASLWKTGRTSNLTAEANTSPVGKGTFIQQIKTWEWKRKPNHKPETGNLNEPKVYWLLHVIAASKWLSNGSWLCPIAGCSTGTRCKHQMHVPHETRRGVCCSGTKERHPGTPLGGPFLRIRNPELTSV